MLNISDSCYKLKFHQRKVRLKNYPKDKVLLFIVFVICQIIFSLLDYNSSFVFIFLLKTIPVFDTQYMCVCILSNTAYKIK